MFRFEFFVDDKHVTTMLRAISGYARELQVRPVALTKPAATKANGSAGGLVQAFITELHTRKVKEFRAREAREIATSVGASAGSYYHLIRHATKLGVLKR